MQYIEFTLHIEPLCPFSEIVMTEMSEIGFESFAETETGFQAYIQKPLFEEEKLKELFAKLQQDCKLSYSVKTIEDENWNAVWESAYEPVLIGDFCFIHAPFHQPNPDVEYNLLIEPKMSFGTAHHATTFNMLLFLQTENLQDKKVLDMGCGTAVLAILAAMRGASYVEAIDTDEWAYANSIENVSRNHQEDKIKVFHGDASLLAGKKFDVVIANINRNILLADIKHYAAALNENGVLLLSGFYQADIEAIQAECGKYYLYLDACKEKDEWIALRFIF